LTEHLGLPSCCRSSGRKKEGQEVGWVEERLAVEGQRRSGCCHQGNEDGRKEDHSHCESDGAFEADDLQGVARCGV